MSSNFLTHVVSLQATPLDTPKKGSSSKVQGGALRRFFRLILPGWRLCHQKDPGFEFDLVSYDSMYVFVCFCMLWLSSERALAWGVMQQLRLSRGLWQSAHRWTDVSRQLRFHFPADPQTTISPSIGIPLMNICTIPANYARCNAVFFGVTSFLPKSMVILAL